MSSGVLFIICVAIVLQCVQLSSAQNDDQIASDRWIRNTLYGKSLQKKCANITQYPKRSEDYKPNRFAAWTVVILKREYIKSAPLYRQQCTGSLIGLGVVLTSASCINGTSVSDLSVRAGEWSLISKDNKQFIQKRRIKSVVIHGNFSDSPPASDIALVFLNEPFIKNSYVDTVCPASHKNASELNSVEGFIPGWDRNMDHMRGYMKFMMLEARLVPKNSCQRVLQKTGLGENYNVTYDFICALTSSSIDMVLSNSGAGFIVSVCSPHQTVIQVGILSHGFQTNALPFFMTAVNRYYNWIATKCDKLCDFSNC